MKINTLKDLYAGQSCFLICDGPSFKTVNKHLLTTPGVITMGVNNAPASFRTDLWLFADSPSKFLNSLKADPRIIKFARPSSLSELQNPKIEININYEFNPETYLSEESVSFGLRGVDGGVRSVMLLALKTLYLLGFRTVYLLGVDFKMIAGLENYHFPQETSANKVRSNNRAYEVLAQRFETMKPVFADADFKVFNCNPDSCLKVFPFISLPEAITAACENMPDPARESTEGMYDRHAHPLPRLHRRAINTRKSARLSIICVLKSGGDFDQDDVINLHRHVRIGFEGIDYEFICYSDLPEIANLEGVTYRTLKNNLSGWWSKLEVFRETGPCIFFDLDTGMLRNLEPLAQWVKHPARRFAILQEWLKDWRHMWNSSVMAWNGDYSYILTEFHTKTDVTKFGDQKYISTQLQKREEPVTLVNDLIPAYSYKFQCRKGIPDDAGILAFHGKPRPRTVGAPFWIGPRKPPFIFIHNPKTAGVSITNALRARLGPRLCTHKTALETQQEKGTACFEKATGYGVVRHPLERLLSAYHFALKKANKPGYEGCARIAKNKTFESFVQELQTLHKEIPDEPMLYPQTHFLCDAQNRPLVQIWPFEQVEQMWQEIQKKHLIGEPTLLPRSNATKHPPWQQCYTPDMLKIATEFYKHDFELYHSALQRKKTAIDVRTLATVDRMIARSPDPRTSNSGILDMLAALQHYGTMVELGCFRGISTALFAQYFDQVTTVDRWGTPDSPKYRGIPWEAIEREARERLSGLPNLKILKMDTAQAAAEFPDASLDFIYIDAGHSYTAAKRDIEAWLPKLKTNGILGGHDYHTATPGVIQAVNELGTPRVFSDTSWIIPATQ